MVVKKVSCNLIQKLSHTQPLLRTRGEREGLGNRAHPACPHLGIQSDCNTWHMTAQERTECTSFHALVMLVMFRAAMHMAR